MICSNMGLLLLELNLSIEMKISRMDSWSGRINIVNMTILPKAIYRSNAISYQITHDFFFTELEWLILKFPSRPRITKAFLRKRSKGRGMTLLDFRIYCKVTVVKTVWYWHKRRYMDQWRAQNKLTYLCSVNLWQRPQEYTIKKKDSLFSKWCWESWTATFKSVTLEHTLTPYIKINWKWLKVLNRSHDSIKLLEENIGKTFSHIKCFFRSISEGSRNKSKNKQMEPN